MISNIDLKWCTHGAITLIFCLLIGYLISYQDFLSFFNETWIDSNIRNKGVVGAIYFFMISIVITSFGAPRQIVAFMGGYAFGIVGGVLLSTAATLGGCVLAFYVSKMAIKPMIRRKFSRQSQRVNHFLSTNPTRKTIIIRLLPIGSNVLTNLIAGSTNVKAKSFFTGSAIGYLPQMLIFSLLGKGMLIESNWKIMLSVFLFFISSYLSFTLYKKYRLDLGSEPTKKLASYPQHKEVNTSSATK